MSSAQRLPALGHPVETPRGRAVSSSAECVPERSDSADPGGDVCQRLRFRNRVLEKELVSLTAMREEYYSKRMREAEEKYERVVKDAESVQAKWLAEQKQELSQLRAGATLMYKMMQHKRERLARQLEKERAQFDSDVEAQREETLRARADAEALVEARDKEHAEICRGYEAQIALLQGKNAKLEEKAMNHESQVAGLRHEIEALKQEKNEQQKKYNDCRKQLAEAEQAVESLSVDTRIKALQLRARQEKDRLEEEVMEYVKFIACTPEARSVSPDFPWQKLAKPDFMKEGNQRRLGSLPPLTGLSTPRRLLKPGEERDVSIIFTPGPLGIGANWKTGEVKRVNQGGQADDMGVKVGWFMKQIDGDAYNEHLVDEKIRGKGDYKIVFGAQHQE